jgi:hypothetical protein
MNIYGKLVYYVTRLIRSTGYSDAEIWSKLAIRSTSKYNLADIIIVKILIDIIPKATFKKSLIRFIARVIETHINWAFHGDFNINYNMISPISEDSDFSDADRFDIKSAKVNELKKILQDNFMDDTISIIFERRAFNLNSDEYTWYLNNNDVHPVQDRIIRNFFSLPFGGWENLDGLNKIQYTKLLVFLLHYMKDGNKFSLLPSILTGTVVSVNEKRILNRPVERKIRESARYQNIMDKYSYSGQMLSKSNVIEQNIMTILNSKIVYNEYNGKRNGEIIEADVNDLCDEYLKFVETL